MPSQAENAEMRDARLEKLALERDRAVALLRQFEVNYPLGAAWGDQQIRVEVFIENVRKFLESLT